jgi:predicted HicB family RNase H-like nuclease
MPTETKQRFVLRIAPETHRRLKVEAARMMMSLTEYTDQVLRLGLARKRDARVDHNEDGR